MKVEARRLGDNVFNVFNVERKTINLEFILSETLSRIKANKEFSNKNRELFFFTKGNI